MEMTESAEELKVVLQAMEQALGWLDKQGQYIAAARLDHCMHELRRPLSIGTESEVLAP